MIEEALGACAEPAGPVESLFHFEHDTDWCMTIPDQIRTPFSVQPSTPERCPSYERAIVEFTHTTPWLHGFLPWIIKTKRVSNIRCVWMVDHSPVHYISCRAVWPFHTNPSGVRCRALPLQDTYTP